MTVNHYSMEIHWSNEDDVFIVSLPEFPVCQTHGTTYQEAVQAGQDAIESIVDAFQAEGRELPEPLTQDRVDEFRQQRALFHSPSPHSL